MAFGLQGNLAFPVIGGVFVGFFLFQVLVDEAQLPFGLILLISALPAFLVFAFVVFFFQGKPPHYLGDLIAEVLSENVVERAQRQPEHPEVLARRAAQTK
jgi:hypothetical protein